jgi:anti-sigma regulatory factor (Ser/Thr protein kinase)
MLAPSDRAPAQAREALGRLSPGLPGATFETLQLLVTELVANSVRHGGLRDSETIRVELRRSPSKIRVEVRDPGRGFVPRLPPSWSESGGMGLFLIDKLASRWEVDGSSETSVWFELEA